MNQSVRTYTLKQSEASGDPEALVAFLQAGSDQSVEIDCSGLRQIAARCLQVLLVAKRHWDEAGQSFALTGIGDDCRAALRVLGVSEKTFQSEGAQ